MSDAILFRLLFATYMAMVGSTANGPGPKNLFELNIACVQTLLLLASSFTFEMASLALKHRHDRNQLLGWLGVTLVLTIVFLGFELHDLGGMADQGGVPSRSGFLSAFSALVPLYGAHVAAGSLFLIAIAM